MPRFLVNHNYGMGSLSWLVDAPTEEAIIEQIVYYLQVDPPNTRVRQVEIAEDGLPRRVAFDINPPIDLSEGDHFERITPEEFEELWSRAAWA